MGWQRVVIDQGRYIFYPSDGGWLEHPLVDWSTGEAAPPTMSYRGDAWVSDDGSISLEAPGGHGAGYGGVRSWRCLPPTPESMQYCAGYRFGTQQRKKKMPTARRGQQFYYGWTDAWKHKQDAARAARQAAKQR